MPILTPTQAGEIALGVYDLRRRSLADALATGIGTDGMFAVDSTFKGASGALMFRELSTFGYVARGVGAFATEAIIATRGTAMMADWITDARVGLQIGPGGLPVHAGFNETFRSFAAELATFFRQHNPTRVHCVGHSLGGALATLAADYVSARRVASVELYTFGCPRVGDGFLARELTQRVGAASIHRVAHPADPVPMIPLFPFWHLPFGSAGLSIARGHAGLVSFGAHAMGESYLPGVRAHSWCSLAAASSGDEGRRVQSWLEGAAEGHGSFMAGSASLLTMIGRALSWLLAKAGQLGLHGVSLTATAGLTALDLIASLLVSAADVSKAIGGHVKALIFAIFRFLGRAVTAAVDLTVAFLRWVLELLFRSLVLGAQRAITSLLP